MTSVTEQVIRDQFPYLTAALATPVSLPKGRPLVFVGCGTSFYLAQTLAAVANARGHAALAVPGAEWTDSPQSYLADETGASVVGLSRSGTTTETISALRSARARGLDTLAITCEPGSEIESVSARSVSVPTDPREGIVMSVSASLMLLTGLRLLGVEITGAHVTAAQASLTALDGAAGALVAGKRHFVTLGAGPLYGIASEAALKMQEMSLSYSQAFHPLEYRHGPISLIDSGSLVTILYGTATAEAEARVCADVRSKGATVIGMGGPGDVTIPVDAAGPAAALVMLPALQLMGEKVALSKGLDTETPRHLTKVVVLEG